MRNALTLTEKETFFLKENRQDPVTGDEFDIGDEIVFCASCKSAFLKESWEYMNSKHCGQTFTLNEFPVHSTLTLSKPIVYNFKKADGKKRTSAYFIDNVIAIFLGFLVLSILVELKYFFRFDPEFSGFVVGSLYMLFRDVIGIKSSLGKRILGLHFIDIETQKKAHFVSLCFRNLMYWICLSVIISIVTILETILNANSIIAIVAILCFFVVHIFYSVDALANQHYFFDKILRIELVEKKK